MSLETLVPPRTTNLVTLATVKALLRPDGDSLDSALSLLIAIVSSSIQDATLTFQLGRHKVRESIAGTPRTHAILSNIPMDPESLVVTIDDQPFSDFTLSSELGIAFRPGGWGGAVYPSWIGEGTWGRQRVVGEDGAENIRAEYYGGYLLPGDISDWAESTPYVAGQWARLAEPSPFRLECTTAGTSGATAPAYNLAGVAASDGGVTWTTRTAWELPSCFTGWAFAEIIRRFQRLRVSSDVWTMDQEGNRTTFSPAQMALEVAPNVKDGLMQWRAGRGGVA